MPTQDYNWQQMKKKPKYHLTSTMCDRKNFVVTYWHTWYRTLYRWASNSTLANQHLRHRRHCSYIGCCHHQILGGPVKREQHLRVHATNLLNKCKQEAEHRWHAGLSDYLHDTSPCSVTITNMQSSVTKVYHRKCRNPNQQRSPITMEQLQSDKEEPCEPK
jgi:hypothetical protein